MCLPLGGSAQTPTTCMQLFWINEAKMSLNDTYDKMNANQMFVVSVNSYMESKNTLIFHSSIINADCSNQI